MILISINSTASLKAASLSSVTDGVKSVTDKAVQSIKDLGDESMDWEKYVRYFRKEHTISVLAGFSSKKWIFSGENFSDKTSYVNGIEFGLRYNYDVSLYRRVGYYLGSMFYYKLPLSHGYLDCFNEFITYEYITSEV